MGNTRSFPVPEYCRRGSAAPEASGGEAGVEERETCRGGGDEGVGEGVAEPVVAERARISG